MGNPLLEIAPVLFSLSLSLSPFFFIILQCISFVQVHMYILYVAGGFFPPLICIITYHAIAKKKLFLPSSSSKRANILYLFFHKTLKKASSPLWEVSYQQPHTYFAPFPLSPALFFLLSQKTTLRYFFFGINICERNLSCVKYTRFNDGVMGVCTSTIHVHYSYV